MELARCHLLVIATCRNMRDSTATASLLSGVVVPVDAARNDLCLGAGGGGAPGLGEGLHRALKVHGELHKSEERESLVQHVNLNSL